ncbi:hypothetical protein WA026_020553, partial [Henosepilachna vigintioctopunctata]
MQKNANSEGASESDSLDSVKNLDDLKSRFSIDVCSRLFTNGTKASEAKMRHLDIFDLEETSWESALRKSKPTNIPKKDVSQENGEVFSRSRNGSIRGSFRKNLSGKNKDIDWKKVYFIASIRKHVGFFSSLDKKNCFRSYSENRDM